jgi:hypothetical protein
VAADELGEDVCALLTERIASISQLETLLLLHRTAPMEWHRHQIAAELRIEARAAEEQLLALAARELLAAVEVEGDVRYRFAPASPALADTVTRLAAAYEKRRVTVVQTLYSRPADGIRVFADAFRLRKEPGDG